MKIKLLFLSLCLCSLYSAQAQERIWNNKQCAVSLTYDDALHINLDHVVPALDSVDLKGTFYLTGYSGALTNRIPEWRKVATQGHELGNHTMFHPCAKKPTGRDFVVPEYDLNTYTVKRITDEMKMTNALLKSIDGKSERTFAFPCGDTEVNGVSYYEQVKNEFVAARGVTPEYVKLGNVNKSNIGSFMINGQTGEQLINLVKKARETNTLIVFLFHGVGGGHALNVSRSAHAQLLRYLKQNEKDIWVAPMVDIARYAQTPKTKVVKPAGTKK